MEVADENASYDRRRYVGENKLSLRPLTWIKQEPLIVPADEVSAVVPKTGGLLA
jgi:hypothetical protein